MKFGNIKKMFPRLIRGRKSRHITTINSLLLIIGLILTAVAGGCQSVKHSSDDLGIKGAEPVTVDGENIVRAHITTRPHNRKVIYHPRSGYWFVFYGHGAKDSDGKHRISWRSSKDGTHWSERHTAYEGNSHGSSLDVLLTGDTITTLVFRPNYHREKASIPELRKGKPWYDKKRLNDDFPLPYEICQYEIEDGNLLSGPVYTVIPGMSNALSNYGSLTQDTEGYFWVGVRSVIGGEDNPFHALVTRSKKANDISAWQPPTTLLKASGQGTITVQVVALDDGKVYAVIFSKSDVKVYGSLYDPNTGKWESPYAVAEGNSESKRAVASFDPGTKRLHLVNVDDSGALRHKILQFPYKEKNWSPMAGKRIQGNLVDSKVTTREKADNNISLSIDTSRKPASLAVAYQKDTPHYRMRIYDGAKWGDAFLVGMQDPERIIDEISMIRDYSDKLGLIYYVLPDEKMGRGELHFMEMLKNDIFNNNNFK